VCVFFCGSLRCYARARQRDRSVGNYWREPTDFLALIRFSFLLRKFYSIPPPTPPPPSPVVSVDVLLPVVMVELTINSGGGIGASEFM